MGSKVHIQDDPYANMKPGADKELYQEMNPYGMTISQARHQWHKQMQEGRSLEEVMKIYHSWLNKGNKPSTTYNYLINDTAEDISGVRNYQDLGFSEARPLADQFGSEYDLDQIKAIIDQFSTGTTAANSFHADALAEAAATEAAAAEAEAAANAPSYLTSDDLSSWWEGIDKTSWGNQQSNSNDDFMRMMMFMSMLNPQGGGYGGGGYGGGGGMNNLAQLISAFGQLGSNNTPTT